MSQDERRPYRPSFAEMVLMANREAGMSYQNRTGRMDAETNRQRLHGDMAVKAGELQTNMLKFIQGLKVAEDTHNRTLLDNATENYTNAFISYHLDNYQNKTREQLMEELSKNENLWNQYKTGLSNALKNVELRDQSKLYGDLRDVIGGVLDFLKGLKENK